jgi:iron complex transport system ATP-binding protein
MSVHARSLVVELGAFQLGPVELALRPSRVTGLIGPNGSGKSTLLRALCGLQRATRGVAQIGERDVDRLDAGSRARTIAFVPHRPVMPGALTVRETVSLGRLRLARDASAIDRALSAVGLQDRAGDSADSLSAGQMHRVAMARMLAQVQPSTALVALDEPTSSLDPAWSAFVGGIARTLASQGHSVLVATHDFSFVGACCDDAVLLSRGTVQATGPVATVVSPESLEALFGAPFVRAEGISTRPIMLPRW